MQGFQNMGVKIERNGDNVIIYGVGLNGLKKSLVPFNFGNSKSRYPILVFIPSVVSSIFSAFDLIEI